MIAPRLPFVLSIAGVLLCGLAACGGTKIPQHSGYKSKKSKPWEKAKEIKLKEGELTGKVSTDLDYGGYKRARWFYVNLGGPGDLTLDMEVVPGGSSGSGDSGDDEEGEDMDVAIELYDPNFNVVAKSDLDTEEENRLKKSIGKKQLTAGKHLVHIFLQGRLDTAEVELKVKFTKGDAVWESDFPVRVAYTDPLAAVPVFDDAPEKKPPPGTGRRPPPGTGRRPPPPPPPPPVSGAKSIRAIITDTQQAGDSVRITLAGGTKAGLADGMRGSIAGLPGSGFTLSKCNADTCQAMVSAAIDDVSAAGSAVIRPK